MSDINTPHQNGTEPAAVARRNTPIQKYQPPKRSTLDADSCRSFAKVANEALAHTYPTTETFATGLDSTKNRQLRPLADGLRGLSPEDSATVNKFLAVLSGCVVGNVGDASRQRGVGNGGHTEAVGGVCNGPLLRLPPR